MTVSTPSRSADLATAGGLRRWSFGGCEIVTVHGEITTTLVRDIGAGLTSAGGRQLIVDLRHARALHASMALPLAELYGQLRARGRGVSVVTAPESTHSRLATALVKQGMPVFDDIADALEAAMEAAVPARQSELAG
ncbi:hypothetical protein EF847_15085 [Actinobacteria bacterium YIM 96077]|uniref:STAS domain-containing protein n=1 Tax=Phytoactinopolyspora halophila TaxID=1981511 RepID=A0A329QWE8_9ACTN|nr:hypothetical protein [Phytoactinopolyspora halophila]AYY13824.1 hypothetical protein EF847_15085 [Actinobacteria bacterium YIM 96077]RAW15632.1 hypothetical protein DPM12_08255 [Phytoactinopolyspora halophila]